MARLSSFGSRALGARLERMRASTRFRDGSFHNTAVVSQGLRRGTALSTIGEFLVGGQRRTPPAPLPSVSPREAWQRPPETGLRATWLGHSTVLVEIDGARVLTDPVWGERASPYGFAGPKRFQPVPVAVEELPPLDAVLVSHDHYDHLDLPTIRRLLASAGDVPFVTSLGVGAHLEAWGVPAERIVELDWWETHDVGPLTITAAPSQHFSGRRLGERNVTLWSSLHVRGPRHSFFFSGDTGLTPEYAEIRARLGRSDLVMLEVGAFHPSWGDIHLGPDNALEALTLLGGGRFLPVHWGTFNLAIHAWDEPAEVLHRRAPERGVELVMPRLGEAVEPARAGGEVVPWWRGVAGREPVPAPTETRAEEPARATGEEAVAAGGLPID